jgi:hypothetical protein
MRLLKISAPEGKGESVARIAFSVGIDKVSLHQVENYNSEGKTEIADVVDLETSTPKAKRFVDALLTADFYNQDDFTLVVRGALSIISSGGVRELTEPLTDTVTDILEELWQFSHITYSFIGRIFIAACLLAYGLIEYKLLLIIAGLLFLPLLPLQLAVGFGAWTGKWKLALQGALALLTASVLLFLGGVAVALLSKPPVRFDDFSPLIVSFLISLAVGIAAGLANIDDVGKREMIGLAATAQLAIVPVWFGICAVFGFPATASRSDITTRALTFFVNFLTIIISSLAVYILTNAASRSISRVRED